MKVRMKPLLLTVQSLILCFFVKRTECACSTPLISSGVINLQNITASSNGASQLILIDGWCANSWQPGEKWIEIDLGASGMGISGVVVGPLKSDMSRQNYFKKVLVQYAPVGSNNLTDFPFPSGKFEIKADIPTTQNVSFVGLPASKVRFTLKDWNGKSCLNVELTGCTIRDLCDGDCQNNGVCVQENTCQCAGGHTGDHCEIKPCPPSAIPIQTDMLKVSSEDSFYRKDQLPYVGWCPAASDKSPSVEIKLSKPLAISVFQFFHIDLDQQHQDEQFMRDFELQYVAPTDSSKIFRTFAPNVPALNGSHSLLVTTQPVMVTDTIRIVPSTWEKRACFKLAIQGCQPNSLCNPGFCKNGGTCMGNNVCSCPTGFYGYSCQITKTNITSNNLGFTKIEDKILYTVSFNFTISGTITLTTVSNETVITIDGNGSYITLDKTQVPSSCLADIDHCSTGFTIGLDINFKNLVDNTFIISSGGNLPGYKGIALYYLHNQLVYVVSTSTKVWTLTVKYQPVLNKWQHFEITWNSNLGIGLYVDGHLLGTFGRPVTRPATTQTASICIGCSHSTSQIVVNMFVKAIQTWALDRTNLVNARLVPAVTASPKISTIAATPKTMTTTTSENITPTVPMIVSPSTTQVCPPAAIPIQNDMLKVSSEDSFYSKDQLPYAGTNRGWCPLVSDKSPSVEIKLSKPLAVSLFQFYYFDMDVQHPEKGFMREFELQYIAPTDSSKLFRTYAPNVPALNGTHFLTVSTQPVVVTDTIRIIPSSWEKRACFKLAIQGCQPNGLCNAGFCKNGGTCMGNNLCLCPIGFYGDSCQITKTNITSNNLGFTRIDNMILYTATYNFTIIGTVSLTTISSEKVITINGNGSYISLDKTQIPSSCFADIDHCTTGFTIGLDINFKHLLDNTFIISSGGNLPGYKGIALYYLHNQLKYVVSTSTKIWSLTVKYQPVLNKWQHFEITWNSNLGLGLYVDGHLLGTFGRPVTRPATTQTASICIGCSHSTSQIVVNMLVKAIQTWALDRTNLVNARLVPAVTASPKTSTIAATPKTMTTTTSENITPAVPMTVSPSTTQVCPPAAIPIQNDMLKVSSEDSFYSKDQLPYAGTNRGWCPLVSDKSPSVEIKLSKPLAVSLFQFYYFDMDVQHPEKRFMREFELQYIAPTDSSKLFRTYAPNVPALNGTHFLTVSTQPVVVTDTIRIIPSSWEKRACFKLAIQGCQPNGLCNAGFCKNGGTCMGNNLCLCPIGFYGDSCQITKTNITSNNLGFTRIDNMILYTATYNFTIIGTVSLTTISSEKVITINGNGSYITLDKTQIPSSCFADIDHCTTGFTIGLDINFKHLLDNTFIISSGGNLPGYKGIALYYLHNQLVYVVSTSTKIWSLTVKYQPVLNKWQHIEITWNSNLGLGLYVDGHLLGTFGRPVTRPATTQTASICIGCSHSTSQIVVNMLVKAIQTWALDRTNLVNARLVPAVTASPKTSTIAATPKTMTTTTFENITPAVPMTVSPSTTQVCPPAAIPIQNDMLKVSSEDSFYSKDQLPYAGTNRGWCPLVSDKSPSVEIKLSKPLAVSLFQFYYFDMDVQHPEKGFMREFELQYIAPTDSSKLFRTYAPNVPALNGTHFLTVSTQPVVVTDTIRIIPSSWEKRACFKLAIQGCQPNGLCNAGFCKNGGTCMGNNLCLCPIGFYGDSCQITKTNITSNNLGFTRIDNMILYTATYNFTIIGTVSLTTISSEKVITINGNGSYISLDKTQIPSSCFADIDHCTTGFTIGLDINFKHLLDNTFIISSGGNLPGYKGIALYYLHKQLVYVVSTSTKIWSLTVKYQPVLNKWQHFEITWNSNLGLGLYVDGHLLGTFGRPVTRPATTQTASICIGCSHSTSQIVVNMLVKAIQTWALDRTNLVNARLVPAVTASPKTSTIAATPKTMTTTTSENITPAVPMTVSPSTTQVCPPAAIPIQNDMLKVSSEDSFYSKDQLPYAGTNRGWCPLVSDKSPSVEIKLSKPLAVSLFQFYYFDMDVQHPEKRFMREFELQYIAPTDSSKLFRTYAPNVPALNGTHFLTVSTQPVVVTDTIRIIPSSWEKRACFKLAIQGCQPNGLCNAGFCKNGGTCMGNNLCLCPIGFYGDSCQITKTNITSNNLGFTRIDNKILYTATYNFTIIGTVSLTTISSEKVITINGNGSYITLDKTQIPSSCFADIDHCTTGFTIGLDINFKHLLDNTFIISSGGNLPGYKGIALYYLHNQLVYVVSTSTKVWTLTVKYQPVLNKWQHFEITWNSNLGLGLYVDGHLLGTFGRPVTRPATTQTASICIGCSHSTSKIVVNMLVKAIQTWALDRTNLVNARLVPAVMASPKTSTIAATPKTMTTTTSENITPAVPMTVSPSTTQVCPPAAIPIQNDMLKVSSEDSFYSKDQLPYAGTNRGWCPLVSDKSPSVEIKLSKHLAVSLFQFYYFDMDVQHPEKRFMREFELQYIAPTDSSKLFRTYAPNVPALNGTHFLTVSTQPVVVTDTIRIIPSSWEKRACFKLAIQGCQPNGLCNAGFCKNGGKCMGNNLCLCPIGFYGDSCQITKTNITSNNLGFTRIDNKILYTATYNFTIIGTVTLTTVSSEKVITINGNGSHITLDKTQIPFSCLADIGHCSSGFTIGLDINFKHLVDNTFIISSGGNLPGYKGIALYYLHNQLVYVVSTSTKIWSLTVKFQPVLNKWQHFEITWNANLGIGLYVDGHLLGTFGRPGTRPVATQTASICIGCSHSTSQIVVNMLVKAIQTWALDRTNLVNARLVPAVTTPSPKASSPATPTSPVGAAASSTAQLTNKASVVSTTSGEPQTSSTKQATTAMPPLYQVYNLTFQTIIGNILITPSFNFTIHGHPALKLQQKGQTALVLNGTKQYVELPDKGIPCLEKISDCKNGFTMQLDVKFTHIDVTKKTYILSSGGDKSGTSGTALYLQGNQLVFAVKQGTIHWTGSCNVISSIKLNIWYNIQVSWSMKGISVVIDGKLAINETRGTPYPGTNVTHPVLIGKTEGANYTAYMMIRNLFTWTTTREVLVSQGVINALTTPLPTSSAVKQTSIANLQTTKSTDASYTSATVSSQTSDAITPTSTVNSSSGVPQQPTSSAQTTTKTSSRQQAANNTFVVSHSTTPVITQTHTIAVKQTTNSTSKVPESTTASAKQTTNVKTTSASTTELPIVEYLWNFTTSVQANTTIYGQTTIKGGGMVFQNSSQYIDFGNKIECLTNPGKCHNGLTIQFTIQFNKLEENTYLLTSGGETPNGVGFAVVFRYGRLQFILSTVTHTWFASCGREKLTPTGYHVVMVSWHQISGLFIYIDNYLIDSSKVPSSHQTAITTVNTVYFGKPHFTISTSVRIDYLVQMVHIWYVRLEILIQKGICNPPEQATTVRPTTSTSTTSAQTKTTKKSSSIKQTMTSQTTSSTPKVTFPSTLTPSTVQQCPVGCVSIVSSTTSAISSTKIDSQTSPAQTSPATKPTATATHMSSTPPPNPSATTTPPLTPPPPNTATPPTSTVRSIPTYHEIPTIHALLGKDKNAYLACTFKGATEADVVLTVSLLIQGQVVLTTTVPGNTGIAQFAVAKVDDNLHKKQIRCSLKASYSGSTLTTNTTISNIFIPQFQVTPNRLTVTEGHSAGHVTVTSTAPPQFYCCKGCKGSCQIHIVTSWTYNRHDLKCDKKIIAQAVIGSTKPQTYNKCICGFSLTVDNWNQGNRIPVKATLDGRRDGDQTRTLTILANIYNQPVGVTVTTTRPAVTFQISTVSVLIKDNDRRTTTCKSVNDPHLTTFDGQRYDNMNEGQFVLYKHKSLPFEVRADYQRCRPKSRAYCNCAVAVKSGDDVITIAGCQDNNNHGHGIGQIMQQLFGHRHGHGHDHGHARTPMTIQMYINGQLTPGTVVRRFGCGQKYEIELPTGTVITVQQSYKPFINIWIKASSSDWQQTEGLCGSYDGHKSNDLVLSSCRTTCVSQFIAHWKVSVNSHFFLGVGVSSVVPGQMYCSYVDGKERICSPGLGVMKCSKSRYDVTSTLVQQAKRPIFRTRAKRQAVTVTPTIPADTDSGVSFEEAMEFCSDAILNNTVTTSCKPILTSNVSDRVEDCAKDYNATGMQVWALDHIRDIAFDCVNTIESLNDDANNTNAGIDLLKTLANTCVDICMHGSCTNGICECAEGYSGETCNVSSSTKPTVSSVPYLCDTSQTADCQLAMVYGNNFVKSDNLTCHFELLKLKETIALTGSKSTSKAIYISLNQVACFLPSQTSAFVRLSNDGTTLSDSSFQYIVYSPDCYDCYVLNNTTETRCDRKVDSCIIDEVCYKAQETSPDDTCNVCLPQNSNHSWSESKAAVCVGVPLRQKADDDMERTQVIILAVVCAVFGALILFGIIYICRKRQNSGRKKESGDYHVAALHRSDTKETTVNSMDNPTYYDYKL